MQDSEPREPEPAESGENPPWLHETLSEALSQRPPSSGLGRVRLLEAAQSARHRYAPFYDRLGTLWALDDSGLDQVFAGAAETSWRRVWPGLRVLGVTGGPQLQGARARLLRFDAGFRLPRHRHRETETVLVLEGRYTDSNHVTVGPGELQEMPALSEHELSVDRGGPCIAAVVERGLDFSDPLLTLLGRWLLP